LATQWQDICRLTFPEELDEASAQVDEPTMAPAAATATSRSWVKR